MIRSYLFDLLFFLRTFILLPICPFVLPYKPLSNAVAIWWTHDVMWLIRTLLRIDAQYAGLQNCIDGPVIYASKHQSALDTFMFRELFDTPVFILKRELLRIPVFGWFLWRTDPIAIDRKAGKKAITLIVQQAKERLSKERKIVIFPEGTRKAYGAAPEYRSGGIMALYELGYPVVPVALNTGKCWPAKGGIKKPGKVTMSFLEPLPQGLNKEELMRMLQQRIESEMQRLEKQDA